MPAPRDGSEHAENVAATSLPPLDAVEEALALAVQKATAACRWDVVVELARELEARRLARSQVARLDVERARRDRMR